MIQLFTGGVPAAFDSLIDDSMVDALHRHSELSASDGAPDRSLSLDAEGKVKVTNSAFPPFSAERTSVITNDSLAAFVVRHKTSGNMADGFGVAFTFNIQDPGTDELNAIASIAAYRVGADTDGGLQFFTWNADTRKERARIASGGVFNIGCTSGTGWLNVRQASPTGARPVASLEQVDVDDTFIDFVGTSAADDSRSISSDVTEDDAKFGAVKVEINGVTKWVRVYDGPS